MSWEHCGNVAGRLCSTLQCKKVCPLPVVCLGRHMGSTVRGPVEGWDICGDVVGMLW